MLSEWKIQKNQTMNTHITKLQKITHISKVSLPSNHPLFNQGSKPKHEVDHNEDDDDSDGDLDLVFESSHFLEIASHQLPVGGNFLFVLFVAFLVDFFVVLLDGFGLGDWFGHLRWEIIFY